jgi:hypothetical protein
MLARVLLFVSLALFLTGCGGADKPPPADKKSDVSPAAQKKLEKDVRDKVEAELANKPETADGVYVKTFSGERRETDRVDTRVNEFLRGPGRKHLTTQSHLWDWTYIVTVTYEYKKQ